VHEGTVEKMRSESKSGWTPRLFLALGTMALGACGGTIQGELADEGEEDVADPHRAFLMLEGGAPGDELRGSPVRQAEEPFTTLGVLYEATGDAEIEVSTSVDGLHWSEWTPIASEQDAEESFAADVQVEGEPALYYRLRSASEIIPSFLSVEPSATSVDEMSPEDELDGLMPEDEIIDEELGVAEHAEGASSFRRYRFDLGRVTRPWLWLLRSARKAGWKGRLAGSMTGLRTYNQQAYLWNLYQSGRGAPAFPPWGPSRHLIRNVQRLGRWAQAVDTQDVSRLVRIARRKGVRLRVPYSNEPWHVEAVRRFHAPSGWNP
jgi:hypothetical protein